LDTEAALSAPKTPISRTAALNGEVCRLICAEFLNYAAHIKDIIIYRWRAWRKRSDALLIWRGYGLQPFEMLIKAVVIIFW
jgi:hypothetical protein